ncbi:MAG: hypothetical protein GY716_01465 [bacterium]|nr:hypothetical protein [bacterium]
MHASTNLHLIHGGHKGAEAAFGEVAEKFGVTETTLSFEGHVMERAVNVENLDDDALDKGRVSMDFVFQAMGRRFVSGHGVRRVLHSMFHLVTRSHDLYAVGVIQENGTVKGGTGWGVELAKLFNRKAHVFDQERGSWFIWDHDEWKQEDPTLPSGGKFSATGTRHLNETGRAAIEDLFQRSLGQPVKTTASESV